MATDPRLSPAGLAASLTAAGQLTDPAWQDAFAAVPRHLFVPRFLRHDGSVVDGAVPADRAEWLSAVYSDTALTTQTRPVPGTALEWPTSSSTRPSLMASMLQLLDLTGGERVLEVGTGTGYNTALLCHRLGDQLVTSVDIHPELVAQATERLAELGYRPRLVVGDGLSGVATAAPYQRILATGAVGAVPPAWIAQLDSSGLIVADLRGELSSSLCVLHHTGSDEVQGRFLAVPGHFMWLRARPDNPLRDGGTLPGTIHHDAADRLPVGVDPAVLDAADLRFLLQHLQRVEQVWTRERDGRQVTHLHAADGSWAELEAGADGYTAAQGGARPLWQLTEQTVDLWNRLGRPALDRFGLTATIQDGQQLWLDTPHGTRRWRLT